MKIKQLLIPVFSLAVCLLVIGWWTYGFSAFTTYSYTLKAAGATPRKIPDIRLVNQDGKVFHLNAPHSYILLNFVYLSCPNVCQKVNNDLDAIYHLMDSSLVPSKLQFVTVSFDLKNDNIQKIKKYRSFYGSDITGWTFALPYGESGTTFHQYLHDIGIYAYRIPGTALINHSSYMFLITPQNEIIRVFDPTREKNPFIVNQIKQCLEESQRA